jgi:hypothetical protein
MLNIVLAPPSDEEFESRLAEMERLGGRDYKEIGVPMFLVAEDLTGRADGRGQGEESGRILAMLLAESAAALRARRPDLSADDIARLIEALADRHFLSLATPAFSRRMDLHPGGAA